MIEIAIDKTPPTQQAIDAQRQVLEANRLSIKRKAITLPVAAILISVTTIAALWFADIISAKQALNVAVAVAYGVAVSVASAGALAVAGVGAGAYGVAVAGVVISAVALALAVASEAIENKIGRISSQIASLSQIAKPDCTELVKIFEHQPQAASYIKTVAGLNRKPTQGEFEILKTYDRDYDRKKPAS